MAEINKLKDMERRDLSMSEFVAELCQKNPGKEPYIIEGARLNHLVYTGGNPRDLVAPDGYTWVDNLNGVSCSGFTNAWLHAAMGLPYYIFFEVTEK